MPILALLRQAPCHWHVSATGRTPPGNKDSPRNRESNLRLYSEQGATLHAKHVFVSCFYSACNNNNVIIIITFKGAIRDFFNNLLTAPRTASSTYAPVAQTQSCANYVQNIQRLSRATSVACHVVRRDSSAIKFDRVEIAFILALFIGRTMKPMQVGRKPEYRRKPPATSFRKCHILQPKNSSPKRDSHPRDRKADVLTVTPRVAPSEVYLRDGSAWTLVRAATLRDKLQTDSPSWTLVRAGTLRKKLQTDSSSWTLVRAATLREKLQTGSPSWTLVRAATLREKLQTDSSSWTLVRAATLREKLQTDSSSWDSCASCHIARGTADGLAVLDSCASCHIARETADGLAILDSCASCHIARETADGLAILPSNSILTPGRPVLALTP